MDSMAGNNGSEDEMFNRTTQDYEEELFDRNRLMNEGEGTPPLEDFQLTPDHGSTQTRKCCNPTCVIIAVISGLVIVILAVFFLVYGIQKDTTSSEHSGKPQAQQLRFLKNVSQLICQKTPTVSEFVSTDCSSGQCFKCRTSFYGPLDPDHYQQSFVCKTDSSMSKDLSKYSTQECESRIMSSGCCNYKQRCPDDFCNGGELICDGRNARDLKCKCQPGRQGPRCLDDNVDQVHCTCFNCNNLSIHNEKDTPGCKNGRLKNWSLCIYRSSSSRTCLCEKVAVPYEDLQDCDAPANKRLTNDARIYTATSSSWLSVVFFISCAFQNSLPS